MMWHGNPFWTVRNLRKVQNWWRCTETTPIVWGQNWLSCHTLWWMANISNLKMLWQISDTFCALLLGVPDPKSVLMWFRRKLPVSLDTVWKIGGISVTQILREIIYGEPRPSKAIVSSILMKLGYQFCRAAIFPNNLRTLKKANHRGLDL